MMFRLQKLMCNHEENPMAVMENVKFSWQLKSDEQEVWQKTYRIIVKNDSGEVVADTQRQNSQQSVDVPIDSLKTVPEERYFWKVIVQDNHGNEAEGEGYFETAPEVIRGEWIEASEPTILYEKPVNIAAATLFHAKPKLPPEKRMMPVTLLRKEFHVESRLKYARIYTTAHGMYQISLNGNVVDGRYFAPEFTSYEKYLCYQVYDVTAYLQDGENACGVMLSDGWWGGRIGMSGEGLQYGDSRGFLMELKMVYEDGTVKTMCTDSDFHWTDKGEIRYSDLFIGEMQDHRYADGVKGFDKPGFDETSWKNVVVKGYGKENLRPQIGPAIRVLKTFDVKEFITTPKGERVVDFGQNIAGMVQLKVTAPKGTKIVLEHSEVLNEKGNYINNIMGVNKDQKDIFICSGNGEETFCDRFSFHGFRYVKVSGIEDWSKASFQAIAVTSEMENAAEFSCSNPMLNQLYSNVRYSQFANMISIPTDCPQRERAGWTGDIQIYSPTACFHQNMQTFLTRWLYCMMEEQFEDGQIPNVIPYNESYETQMRSVFKEERSAGWGDACVIVPWVLYQQYGDKDILETCWPMMTRWMNYVKKQAETEVPNSFAKKKNKTPQEIENQKYLWNTGWHFGDWLIPSYSKSLMTATKSGKVTKDIIAPAYYAYTTDLMAKIAEVLGKEEAVEYKERHSRIQKAFAETYFHEDGRMEPDLQGLYVCALAFGLVPNGKEQSVAEHVVELIRENQGCLDTGFLSTPLLLDVLCRYGHEAEAYQLLYQEKCPSWLYEVKNGATTIWESWQAVRPDGKVSIYSYNHYALGCVFDWIYRNINGINMEEPAYRKIRIAPSSECGLTYAKAEHECNYGTILSEWEKNDHEFILRVEIPCNTSAEICLPDGTRQETGSGSYQFTCSL